MSYDSPHKQVAALPYRKRGGRIEVLLITSRETKRWVIPKGWPMAGKQDYEAAAQEAFEEAGVEGRIGKKSIGYFDYVKRLKNGAEKQCRVEVYPLKVFYMKRVWPEKLERTRKWYGAKLAATLVQEEGLRAVIEATLM